MSLYRNCGRFTAKPIAVRLAAALKPVIPSSVISIDGISSDAGLSGSVMVPRCDKATRNSFEVLAPKTLFIQTFTAWLFGWAVRRQPRRRDLTCPVSVDGRVVEQVAADQRVVLRELVIDAGDRLVVVQLL